VFEDRLCQQRHLRQAAATPGRARGSARLAAGESPRRLCSPMPSRVFSACASASAAPAAPRYQARTRIARSAPRRLRCRPSSRAMPAHDLRQGRCRTPSRPSCRSGSLQHREESRRHWHTHVRRRARSIQPAATHPPWIGAIHREGRFVERAEALDQPPRSLKFRARTRRSRSRSTPRRCRTRHPPCRRRECRPVDESTHARSPLLQCAPGVRAPERTPAPSCSARSGRFSGRWHARPRWPSVRVFIGVSPGALR